MGNNAYLCYFMHLYNEDRNLKKNYEANSYICFLTISKISKFKGYKEMSN